MSDVLISALESFIHLHTTTTNQGGLDGKEHYDTNLDSKYSSQLKITPEARVLLIALHNFISSTLLKASHSENPDKRSTSDSDAFAVVAHVQSVQSPESWDEIASPALTQDDRLAYSVSSMDVDVSLLSSIASPINKSGHNLWQLPFGLRKALKQRIHDQMPIRLLTFLPDGSRMELVERSDAFHRITRSIQAQLNQEVYNQMINDKLYDPIDGQRVSLGDAEEAVIAMLVQKHTKYAILSHIWIRNEIGEVEHKDWPTRTRKEAGYSKLRMFCEVAAQQHGVLYAWMDSVCINKESSSELDESIRSMYQWYRDASVCLTYLADTESIADMRQDNWFKRGWTLQELLAPLRLKFYNKHWQPLTSAENDKCVPAIERVIQDATHITPAELASFTAGNEHLSDNSIPISRRMLWAAHREVTRGEDAAYSLMGVFGVSLSIAYGEGSDRAFFRLIKKILTSFAEVWDIFNCAGPYPIKSYAFCSRVIPSSPKHYLQRSDLFNDLDYGVSNTPREPITLTHLGLRVRLLLIPAVQYSDNSYIPFGQYSGSVTVHFQGSRGGTQTYNLLDRDAFYAPSRDRRTTTQATVAFGILNFVEDNDTVSVPGNSLAFGFWFYNAIAGQLSSSKGRKQVMKTNRPIVFQLAYRQLYSHHMNVIDKKDLKKEGIELMSLYL